jgi:chromosome segregation ATPase
LGYAEFPLGLESATLAQHMLEDLVTDTDRMNRNNEEIARLKRQLEIADSEMGALRTENARISRDNIQLHHDLVFASEDAVRRQNQHSVLCFELETDSRRLKLLNRKAVETVKDLQREVDELKQGLQQALSAPTIMKVPEVLQIEPWAIHKKQRSPPPSPARSAPPTISFSNDMFTHELDNLRKESHRSEEDNAYLRSHICELEAMIRVRDVEIERLGHELEKETGTNDYVKAQNAKLEAQQAEIDKLRTQVRVVNPKAVKRRVLTLVPPKVEVSIDGCIPRKPGSPHQFAGFPRRPPQKSPTREASSPQRPAASPPASPPRPAVAEAILVAKSPSSDRNVVIPPALPGSVDIVRTVAQKEAEIQSLTTKLSKMAADFAFVHDGLATVVAENEAVIRALRQKNGSRAEVLVDTEGMDTLQQQILEMRESYEKEIDRRDAQIQQLQNLVQSRSAPVHVNASPPRCSECARLRRQLEEIEKVSQEEIQAIRQKLTQPPPTATAAATDRDVEKLRRAATAQQNELKDCQRKLVDAESRIRSLPDVEQRYKSVVEQLRSEHVAMRNDLKQKTVTISQLTSKLSEAQKMARDFQRQVQKSKDEAPDHPAVPPFPAVSRDPAVQLLIVQAQLHEKTQESSSFERTLAETRKQLTPLVETVIPQLKAQVAKHQRDRDQNIARIQRLIELGDSLGDSPEFSAFLTGLKEIKAALG